jgi:tetratricopeptide (TPR) repeat protein
MNGRPDMTTQLARLIVPTILVVAWGTGCVVTDEPSVEEALRTLLAPPEPPPEIKPAPVTRPVVDLKPVEDAATERRVQALAHYSAALTHELNRRKKEALAEYFKSGMADPTDETLVLRVSRKLLESKDSHHATLLLVKATEGGKISANLNAWLGIAYAREGKLDLAILASEAAIRKDPLAIQGHKNLCRIYSEMNRSKAWKKVLEQAGAAKNPDASFLIELAALHHAYGLKHGAELMAERAKEREILGRARKLKPASLSVVQQLAEAFERSGGFAEAAGVYEDLIKTMPDGAVLRERAAQLYLRAEQPEKARAHLEALLKDNLTNPQANRLMGFLLAGKGEHAKAIKFFERVITINPRFQPGYYDLAEAQMRGGKPKDAKQTLEGAAVRFPRMSYMHEYMMAIVHVDLEEYAAAIRHFNAAEKQATRNAPAQLTAGFYFQKGAAQERAKQFAQAEKSFRQSLKLDPGYASALNYLGYMWAERGENLKEARQFIEKALKQFPESAAFLDSMAWVVFKQGDVKGALEWQLKALKAMETDKEKDAVLYEHLGDIYHALKNNAKAREFWEKSLATEANPKVKARLDKLPQP